MMFSPFRRLVFALISNVSLFLILMIGIQNSSNKKKVNFIINKSVDLPISFIIGISFISGSITGSLITINSGKKKD